MAVKKKWRAGVLIGALATALASSACSPGSLGSSSDSSGGAVTLSYLVDNGPTAAPNAEALAAAFTAKNPDITIKVETRPEGGEGDNIVKTRLATGEMTDIFSYNSGSLFQALSPEQNLVPLTDQPWVKDTTELFQATVKKGDNIYGAPDGTSLGGGILYNTKVYQELGLNVPKSWAEFMANNAKIKDAGIDPVLQSYQDTWTSQLWVLADFHNIAAVDPQWAEKYTAGQAKYVDEPAVRGFQRQQEVHDAGYFNKDFASTSYTDAMKLLGEGKAAHYPLLTSPVAGLAKSNPELVADIGFFPMPGDDAAKNGLTLWLPGGIYIPKSTEGPQLDAAKKFLAFVATPEGCEIQSKARVPSGPYVVAGCELPADAPKAATDLVPFIEKEGASTPALEFLSPIKGPALEQITVEVGSGLKSAAEGAALYDKDVKKQAQQLGLPGWE